MMNTEAKKLWVEALRSGEYKQTKHLLHDDEGYCCLGVLCEVTRSNTKVPVDYDVSTNRITGYSLWDDQTDVSEWSEIPRDTQWYLAGMNDDKDKTFAEIADYIEEHL